MKTRGKRTREQTGKNTSGITPPQKRKGGTSRQHKQLNQTLLSDWLTDDETTHSQTNATSPPSTQPPSTPTTSTTPPPTELSLTQSTGKLNPIMSQPRGSATVIIHHQIHTFHRMTPLTPNYKRFEPGSQCEFSQEGLRNMSTNNVRKA